MLLLAETSCICLSLFSEVVLLISLSSFCKFRCLKHVPDKRGRLSLHLWDCSSTVALLSASWSKPLFDHCISFMLVSSSPSLLCEHGWDEPTRRLWSNRSDQELLFYRSAKWTGEGLPGRHKKWKLRTLGEPPGTLVVGVWGSVTLVCSQPKAGGARKQWCSE